MNKDNILYTIFFTFIVCAFFVFFLAGANELTKEQVAANQRMAQRSAVLSALGIPFSSPSELDEYYDIQVKSFDTPEGSIYRAVVDGQIRFAKIFSGAGLWGTISGILAVNEGVTHIAGLRIVSHNETPGLGGRIDEGWFQDQFSGERILPEGIRIRQGDGSVDRDAQNGILDGVTGASRTSAAMENIINKELSLLRKLDDQGVLK